MEIVIRATVVFWFLVLLTRTMGKRELAQMSAVELILLVTIGDLVQQGVTQEDMSLTGNMLAVGTIGVWILFLSYVSYRFKRAEKVIEGVPIVVVRDGEIVDESLKLERLTRDEVLGEAREQGIDDLAKVRVAILEHDGKFSFVQRESQEDDEDGNPQPKESTL